MRSVFLLASCGLAALTSAAGCGHDDPPQNKPPVVQPSQPPGGGVALPGTEGPVEVVIDDRGMPHIYTATLHDAALAQGYLMARDRFPQMEMMRRNVTGRIAELITPGVRESRDDRLVRGMLDAIAFLRERLGDDPGGWRWGRLHTITFKAVVPALLGESESTIPGSKHPTFPGGFPRPGDSFGVDASSYGMWSTTSFSYGAGPVQRLVVEMTPDGPRAWNALPGGQVYAPDSPHHADEVEHWRLNEAPPLYFKDEDVNAHVEATLSFVPET